MKLFTLLVFLVPLSCATNRFEIKLSHEYKLDSENYADYTLQMDTLISAHVTSVCVTPNQHIFFEVEFEYKGTEPLYFYRYPFVIAPLKKSNAVNLPGILIRSYSESSFQLIKPNRIYTQSYIFSLPDPVEDTSQVSLYLRTAGLIFNAKRKNVCRDGKSIVMQTFNMSEYLR